MLDPNQRQDPLLYIAVSNGAGAQALLKQYGFPEIDDKNIVYEQLQQLVKAHPDLMNKLMTEYHPDRQWFTSKSCTCKDKGKEHSKYCAYCGTNNYTTDEAAQIRQRLEDMSCDALKASLHPANSAIGFNKDYADLVDVVAAAKKCSWQGVIAQDGHGLPVSQQTTTTRSIVENNAVTGLLNWATDNRKLLTGVAIGIVIYAIIKN